MLVTGGALLVASSVFVAYELSAVRSNMVRALSVQAQIVSANSAASLLFNDPDTARKTLSALRAAPNIISAGIYFPSGALFAAYWRDSERSAPPPPPLSSGQEETHGFTGSELFLVRRIVFQNKQIGTVYIRSDLKDVSNRLQRYVGIVAAVLLISLMAAFVLSAPFQRAISRPIVQLVDTARIISREKDYSVRAPAARSHDEIAVLVNAFNEMLGQIQQQAEDRQKFVALVEQSDDFIGMCGLDGKVIYINRAGARLVGLDPMLAAGTPISEMHPENWWVKLRDEIFPAIMRGEGNWIGEAQLCDVRTKRPIDVLMNVFPLRDPVTGQVLCFSAVMRDITERKHLEEQLRQAQKLESIGQLAGGIAHDFNNLLVVISGYAHMLLEDLPKTSPMQDAVAEIAAAGDRASGLTRQLLAFSRRQRIEPKDVVLNDLVRNVEKLLRRLIGEDIDLILSLESGAGVVRADPGHLEQVIMNLAVNARDAMPHGGKLIIETAHLFVDEDFARTHIEVTPGEYVMLAVADNGLGMTADVQSRMFEPFFTTKEKGKGTGLGLSTVYGIVKQSGGSIWVYSEPGRGSTFKILLPAVRGPREEMEVIPDGQSLSGNETILVTEDEAGVRNYLRQLLEHHGYRVLEAADGKAAMQTVRDHPGGIHLLLTDIVMPGMSGTELADQFASLYPEVPIVYMSGYSNRLFGREIPEGSLIQKPFTARALLASIRDRLDQIRA
jgi:PAS domain S-box-containing protein